MAVNVPDILRKIRALEAELERDLSAKQEQWHYRIEASRVRFEHDVRRYHRRIRQSIPRFLRQGRLLNLLSAPVIYSMALPLLLLDLWISVYQLVCFPIYGIPRVRRHDYFVIDRQHLAYLNGIEKLNCVYCGYANGLVAYIREITGRTEQYWCPIKHARRTRAPHPHYQDFVDYGDPSGYSLGLPRLRRALRTVDGSETDDQTRSSRDDTSATL